MSIQNFPSALQPIIQQGFLDREFDTALRSRLGFRAVADRLDIAAGIGETLTKTRAGLKPAVTTPGQPSVWGVEQYTIIMNLYDATTDLNMVTSRVGIVSQFLQNAYANGEQAARSLDELARNALFAAYLGGNTRVRVALSSPAPVIAVDDIRGFQNAAPLTVTIGSNVYSAVLATADITNVSTTPGGRSGTITLSGNVSVADGAINSSVVAGNAPSVIRPGNRENTQHLTPADTLTMSAMLDAVTKLRINAVPEIDGAYNCYLDPVSARQLFNDPDFRQLFQGATSANQVFRRGMVNDFLGLRFVPTNETFVQMHPAMGNQTVRRPIICGAGALVEGDFTGMAAADVVPADSIVTVINGVAMVTREAIDRLHQIIAQSWYWIGGFSAPFDTTSDPRMTQTTTNAAYKRAVIIEHAS